MFTLALGAISYAASIITGHTVTYSKANLLVAVAYVLWISRISHTHGR